jgi:hypothetical protein
MDSIKLQLNFFQHTKKICLPVMNAASTKLRTLFAIRITAQCSVLLLLINVESQLFYLHLAQNV